MRVVKKAIIWIVAIFLMLAIGACGVMWSTTRYLDDMSYEKLDNYKDGKFVNPVPTTTNTGSFWNTQWRWMTSKNIRNPKKKLVFKAEKIEKTIKSNNELKVMWVGHSTLFIEIDGKRFLTDPVWSDKASPVSFLGPSRFHDAPLKISDIPKLDGIIISHNHYDHLDHKTIMKFSKRGEIFYTPLGVGQLLISWGVPKKQVKELNWWEDIELGDTHKLIATPSRHFSNRGIFDMNKTLWASWVIQGSNHKVFFGGDGGYWEGFKDIGNKYGPFDITFLEVGASDKNWKDIHLGPENAAQAHIDLKGDVLFPIHWGTFNLAIHAWIEPAETLLKLAESKNIKVNFVKPGEMNNFADLPKTSKWWSGK